MAAQSRHSAAPLKHAVILDVQIHTNKTKFPKLHLFDALIARLMMESDDFICFYSDIKKASPKTPQSLSKSIAIE